MLSMSKNLFSGTFYGYAHTAAEYFKVFSYFRYLKDVSFSSNIGIMI